ncbi:MAG: PhoX family phosphatase [Phycisphaerales bacterium]|nr:PhoX family phosphatase [Hyphomonadaceae bacterium]
MSRTKHLNELIASRRALLGGLAGLPLLNLAACATSPATTAGGAPTDAMNFASVPATNADTVTLPPGYRWRKLIAWGDALFETVSERFDPDALTRAEQEQRFGQNNDMLACFAADYAFPPPADSDRLILCANNEYASLELAFPSLRDPRATTPAQIEALYAAIGVSVVDIERTGSDWRVVRGAAPGSGHNRRITPFTPVEFTGPAARHPWIAAAAAVVNASEPDRSGGRAPVSAVRCGTAANCAGGLTPWGTYLTAEENFDSLFVGSERAPAVREAMREDAYVLDAASFGYVVGAPFPDTHYPRQFRLAENPHGPALYGWITEIDPHDPHAAPKKRTALGRKKNECATTALARDGRVVVYMGDDQRNEHVYKFVSRGRFDPNNRAANMDLLDNGDLFVAQFEENGGGRWLRLTVEAANAAAAEAESPIRFRDEADLMVRVRDAARLMGATPMDRPEDIEALQDANWRGLGPVLIACTNNSERGFERPGNPRRESDRPNSAQANVAGHILRLDEAGGDSAALRFGWDIFAMGGDPNATATTAMTRGGLPAHVSTKVAGVETISGERFACPDNLFIDSTQRVWISTDGGDSVFADCNDCVMVTSARVQAPRAVKRFLVGPIGSEACGPLMAPDERSFFCAIQHPGGNDVAGNEYGQARWRGAPPNSHFPDGGDSWPRSAVVVVTRDDGGRIGD